MAFSSNSDTDAITDINITPFVDVVLVLLVIFMVTAPMLAKRAIELKLPSASVSDNVPQDTLGLAVAADGTFLLFGKRISDEGLFTDVAAAHASNPNVEALIAADTDARHGRVIKMIEIVKRAGIEAFAFEVIVKEP